LFIFKVEPLVTQTILTMSLLHVWVLKVVLTVLSMWGQKALGSHQKNILIRVLEINKDFSGLE